MNHNGRTVDKFIFPSTSWFSGGVWLAFGETVIGVPKVPALSCIYLLLFSFHSISRKKNGTLGGYLSATFGYMHSSLEFLARDAFGKQM